MTAMLLRRNRNFRLLFSGAGAANLGDGVAALALPWLATLISRDPFHIALVAFATRLPWFLVALPVGVLTDRADRQALMVRADLLRLVLSLGIVALVLAVPATGVSHPGAMILMVSALAFALGTAEVVRDNAAQTCLPMLVDERDLERANGQIWSIEQIMGQFVGPPIAGLLIAWALPVPFSFNALAFGLAAFCVWSIAFPAVDRPRPNGFWRELQGGIAWLWQQPSILQLAIMLGVMNALHMAMFTVLVLYSQEVLGLGAFGHGVLLTAGALGGVIGGVLCPGIAARLGQRRSLLVALAVMPLPFALLYMTSSPVVAGLALFVSMLAALLWNVVTVSYRQRVIPDGLLGRVNSIYRFFGWGMMPIGALAGGIMVDLAQTGIGRDAALRLPMLIAAVGMTGMWAYAMLFLRLGRRS